MTAGILRWAWLVGWLLVERVAGQVVTVKAVVNSTGKTAPTSLISGYSRGISYQEAPAFPQGTYFIATHGSGSTTPVKYSNQYLFASNGTQLAKLENLGITSIVEAAGMSEMLFAFTCSRDSGQFTTTLSILNGLHSFEQHSQQTFLNHVMAIWVEPNTQYAHYVQETGPCVYSRWRLDEAQVGICVNSVCRNPPSFYSVQDQILVYGACSTPVNLAYHDKTSGQLIKSLSTPSAVYSHISDYMSPLKIYAATYQASPVQFLTALDTSITTGAVTQLFSRIQMDPGTSGTSLNSQLMLVKNFGYLAFLVENSSGGSLRLVDTSNFSYVAPSAFTELQLPLFRTQNNMRGLQLLKRRRMYFALQAIEPGFNFQSFYLDIDLCQKVGVDRCAACPVGYYVSPAINAPVAPAECFPVGFGKSWVSPTVSNLELEPCADPHCVECAQNVTTCTKCKAQNNTAMFLFRGACIFSEQIPPAWGAAAGQQQLEPCADANCRNCSVDHNTCTVCQESDGFTLIDGTCTRCEQVRPMFVVRTEPAAGADVTIDMYSNPALKSNTSLFQDLKDSEKLKVSFWSSTEPPTLIKTDTSILLKASSFGFSVNLAFATKPPESRFKVRISTENFTYARPKSENTGCTAMQQLIAEFELDPPQFSAKSFASAQDSGKMVAAPISMMTADHPVGASVQSLATLLDTSGAFGLVGRSAPLMSRLAFINIKFGVLLGAYLESSRYSMQDTARNTVMRSDGSKGKITLYRLPVSAVEALFWKVLLYIISWMNLLALRKFWAIDDPERNSTLVIRYHYFSHKVHFVAFSMCLPDATFLLPRTVLDSRGVYFIYYALALLVWWLLLYDILLIYTHLTSPWKLMQVLEEDIGEFRLTEAKPADKPTDGTRDMQNQPQTKQINYKKTYFNIDNNIHLLASLTGVYKIDPRVSRSVLCQSLMLCSWIRLIALQQLGILACQYCVKFGLSFMLLFETIRITCSIVAYWEYKYYRSAVVLLIDIIQTTSFVYFVGVCLWISDSASNSSVNVQLQQLTIWISTVGVFSEYLLTGIYVVLCLWRSRVSKSTMTKLKLEKVNSGWLKYASLDARKQLDTNPQELPSSVMAPLIQNSAGNVETRKVVRKSKAFSPHKRTTRVKKQEPKV